ncbi:MAG: 16S rRNA (adenine(1518)-N(6)/adenine(1519)-N(6))-dimethyltransferase RsmA [Spirochaetales bacterium]|nr:16S rRNA (adenine(1518)-N(6)/adenine(1519)-N(6))-dimethyltransferase RsmA [Spirochaetales bacterium]
MDWSKIDNSPTALRRLLEQEGLAPKKRWGQNFMIAPGARSSILAALDVRPDDLVWEIGPGLGAITAMLVESARQVVVFEIDHGIMRVLRERFGPAITIVAGDAVKTLGGRRLTGEPGASALSAPVSPGPDLVAGNLPYRSAAAIVAVLLETVGIRSDCRRMVFTVQREMARRMVASPGGKDYSPLSVLCTLTGSVTHNSDLAAGSFYPAPEVVSSLVSVEPKPVDQGLLQLASICARSLFTSRRKTIRNNLPTLASAVGVPTAEIQEALDEIDIENSRRAETVEAEAYLRLAERIRSRRSSA